MREWGRSRIWVGLFVCGAAACGQELVIPTNAQGTAGNAEAGPSEGFTGGGAPADSPPGEDRLPVIDQPVFTTFGGAGGDASTTEPTPSANVSGGSGTSGAGGGQAGTSAGRAGAGSGGSSSKGGAGGTAGKAGAGAGGKGSAGGVGAGGTAGKGGASGGGAGAGAGSSGGFGGGGGPDGAAGTSGGVGGADGAGGTSSGADGGGGGTDGSAGAAGGGAGSPAPALIFSEYVEAPGSFKALELFALVGGALEGCELQTYSNGKAEPSRLALHGELAQGEVYVLCSSALAMAQPSLCDRSTNLIFNGDDALGLSCAGALLDIFGEIGVDPGEAWGGAATLDHTLQRACTVSTGRTDNAQPFVVTDEWVTLEGDPYAGLGRRDCGVP